MRLLWDSKQTGARSGPLPPPVSAYRDFVRCKLHYRERVRTECAPADERHRRWRERQVHRVHWQLGPASEAHRAAREAFLEYLRWRSRLAGG